jgi:phosphoribosylamine--glycine ligase
MVVAKVLVIGSGGREQALAWKLAQSPEVETVFVAPGNGGSSGKIKNLDIDATDVDGLLNFANKQPIDLTIVGQEAASAVGVVDAFLAANRLIFGPTKAATRLESSKIFAKDLMHEMSIPTADYQSFAEPKKAAIYAKSRSLPVVIKADGLAAGKGVIIARSEAEIDSAIQEIMVDKAFGSAGAAVVVEDFLAGQEVSIHALSDGKKAVVFPASQDHKQVYDGDKGPNTGGMGVIAPVDWVKTKQLDWIDREIVLPTLSGLAKQGTPFTGCLYPGLMIEDEKIKVLEFNARFGDPEAEVYMRLFDGDLYRVLLASAQGKLDPSAVKWRAGFAVSVVLCSKGYPGNYPTGLPISGLDEAEKIDDVVIFHAATKRSGERILTAGGRVLNVTATGSTLGQALEKAYTAASLIDFDGVHYRRDIGRRSRN